MNMAGSTVMSSCVFALCAVVSQLGFFLLSNDLPYKKKRQWCRLRSLLDAGPQGPARNKWEMMHFTPKPLWVILYPLMVSPAHLLDHFCWQNKTNDHINRQIVITLFIITTNSAKTHFSSSVAFGLLPVSASHQWWYSVLWSLCFGNIHASVADGKSVWLISRSCDSYDQTLCPLKVIGACQSERDWSCCPNTWCYWANKRWVIEKSWQRSAVSFFSMWTADMKSVSATSLWHVACGGTRDSVACRFLTLDAVPR